MAGLRSLISGGLEVPCGTAARATLATEWHPDTPARLKAFRIEPDQNGDSGSVRSPYLLHGEGGSFYLVRNDHKPQHLFSVNHADFRRSGKVAGYIWFTDASGKLLPVK